MAEIMKREPKAHLVRYWNTHPPTKDAILRFFPAVKFAVADAKELLVRGIRTDDYTDQELIEAVLDALQKHGRVPSLSHWATPGMAPTVEAFARAPGGYRRVLQKAYADDGRSLWEIMVVDAALAGPLIWGEVHLVTMLQSETLFLGSVPSEQHWHGRVPGPGDFNRVFDSYERALEAAGLGERFEREQAER